MICDSTLQTTTLTEHLDCHLKDYISKLYIDNI